MKIEQFQIVYILDVLFFFPNEKYIKITIIFFNGTMHFLALTIVIYLKIHTIIIRLQ